MHIFVTYILILYFYLGKMISIPTTRKQSIGYKFYCNKTYFIAKIHILQQKLVFIAIAKQILFFLMMWNRQENQNIWQQNIFLPYALATKVFLLPNKLNEGKICFVAQVFPQQTLESVATNEILQKVVISEKICFVLSEFFATRLILLRKG